MTTPSTERKAGPLLGTGAQTTWPFTFKVFAATDIAVTIADSLGVETALVYGVDYSVTLNANQETSPGGTVTYPISGAALPVGKRLVIFGNLPYDQPLDLPSGGNFSPLALENQLDRTVMQVQQLRENVGRALQLPVTAAGTLSVQLPPPSANQLIGWDAGGSNLQNVPLADIATALAFATYRFDTFTGDGVETQFTLSADPATLGNLDIAVGGVTQTPGTDYTLLSGVLVFISAPPLGATILARYGEGLPPGATSSAFDVAYTPAGLDAVVTNVEAKLRETASVKDFGADPTGAADSYQAFSAAPDNAFVPAGTYDLSASIIGKTFYSFEDVTVTGAGSANIVNVVKDFDAGFVAVDPGVYPGTSLEYKSEPSLVATTSGKLICFYRIGPGHQGDAGDTGYLVYRVYDKLTNSWSDTQIFVNRAGFDSRNQIAGVTPTGRIIVAYYQCEYTGPSFINESTRVTKYRYSDDDGLTWSAEFNLSQYCPFPMLDNVPFGPIVSFADGRLLISIYNFRTIITLRSTDNGTTWGTTSASVPNPNPNITTVYTTPVWSDDSITEPCIVKVSESSLVCIGRSIPSGVVDNGTARFKYFGRRWTANTRYEVGMWVNTVGGRMYECTVAGTSSATSPTHTGGTLATDGTVTWLEKGAWAAWSASTAYSVGQYLVTYSEYLYRVQIAGTTGTVAPSYSKLEGNETQLAFIKSDNGGSSWGSRNYVTWTTTIYQASTSPPRAIVRGDTVDVAWYSRNPEFNLYRVRMSARGFFENPEWAFSITDGERRNRVMKSYIAKGSNPNGWRIDVGYVDLIHLPWTDKIMAAWYDKAPAQLRVAGKTTLYSTVIEP